MTCEQEKDAQATLKVRGRGRFRLALLRNFFGSENEGGSLVEFAMVLPMMMLLMTGMFAFGIALNNYIVLTDAINAGARTLSMTRGQTIPALAKSDPCAYSVQVANSAAPLLDTTKITYGITWTTTNSSGQAVTTSYTNSCAGVAFTAGDTVVVQGTFNYALGIYGWKGSTVPLSAQSVELVQ